jgi:hypothetical protein
MMTDAISHPATIRLDIETSDPIGKETESTQLFSIESFATRVDLLFRARDRQSGRDSEPDRPSDYSQ